MRFRNAVAVAAVALALTTASACDSGNGGGGDSSSSADGDGLSAGSGGRLMGDGSKGRPSAATMADIASFVSERTTCTNLFSDPKDPEHESVGSEWGIKERGVCYDADRMGISLLAVNDMKAFQTRAKKRGGGYYVGKDFAVYSADPTTLDALQDSGLLYLSCEDPEKIPSGFTKEPALVGGCVLTNHPGMF
ncbi:hypothetical protein [Streptomyces sp. NPDC057694]|uniref:hypothetical protein n=1 Tax=Streptomyces sp. NPDC057694 TaxID=3346216 RepID=UPI0036ADC074